MALGVCNYIRTHRRTKTAIVMTFEEFRKEHYFQEQVTWMRDHLVLNLTLYNRSDDSVVEVFERRLYFTPPAVSLIMLPRIFSNPRNHRKKGYETVEEMEKEADEFIRSFMRILGQKHGITDFDPTNRRKYRKRSKLMG
jgi:hypothetical protein